MLKRTLWALAGLIWVAGCSGETTGTVAETASNAPASAVETLKIGLSFDSLNIERWQRDKEFFEARAAELGAQCVFQSADGDARKQNQQCESLLAQGIDVLVIVPKSATAAAQAVEMAKAEGVPVLSYDRLILDSNVDVYLSFDNRRVGRMQAEALTERTGDLEKARYFLLGGDQGDNNAKMFREGQMEVIGPLVEAGKIEIIGDQWADGWSPAKAREIIENMLVREGTDVDAILASNDGTAGGVIQALRAQGLDGKVLVSGQDADLEAVRRVVEGTQTMTVYKPLKTLATRGAEVAVKLAKGEDIAATETINNGEFDVPAIFLTPIALDQESVVEVLADDGFYTRELMLGEQQ